MSNSTKPERLLSFSDMLKTALGSRVDQNAGDFVDLMAPDGVMEFPYAPAGGVKRLEGQAAINKHMASISDIIEIEQITDTKIHQTLNPEVVIIEFNCIGTAVKTGQPYNQNYISVITTHAGKIIHYIDYWNPLIALAAIGETDMPTDPTQQEHSGQRSTKK